MIIREREGESARGRKEKDERYQFGINQFEMRKDTLKIIHGRLVHLLSVFWFTYVIT